MNCYSDEILFHNEMSEVFWFAWYSKNDLKLLFLVEILYGAVAVVEGYSLKSRVFQEKKIC